MLESRFAQLYACIGAFLLVGLPATAHETGNGQPGSPASVPAVCVFKKDAAGKFIPPEAGVVYKIHQQSPFMRVYDKNCNGRPDREETDAARIDPDYDFKLSHVASARIVTTKQTLASAATPDAAPPPASAPPAKSPPAVKAPTGGAPTKSTQCALFSAYPFVRNSYADLNFVSTDDCPPDLGKATGATFSYTRDAVMNNTQWLAKGVAGVRIMGYSPTGCATGLCLGVFAVAPLVNFQRVTNSNPKDASSNIDVLSPGFSSEAFFYAPNGFELYVRDRMNENGTFEGQVNSWSNTFQLEPVYAPLIGERITIGDTYWLVEPLVNVQNFQRVDHDTNPIFAYSSHVFRYGPGVVITMRPTQAVPPLLQPITYSVAYDWYHEQISDHNYQHLLTSLTYNVTANWGITASYEKGEIEETGAPVALTTVGLSVKY